MRKLRILTLLLSLIAALTLARLWLVSSSRWHFLTHTSLAQRSDAAVPDGQMGRHILELTTWSLGHSRGHVELIRAQNLSLSAQTPTAEELKPWQSGLGFHFRSLAAPPETHNEPTIFYNRADDWRLGGFAVRNSAGGAGLYRALWLPLWFCALIVLTPAFLIARSHIKRLRRVRRNLCVHCGYDLANVKLVCPECGNDGRSAR